MVKDFRFLVLEIFTVVIEYEDRQTAIIFFQKSLISNKRLFELPL